MKNLRVNLLNPDIMLAVAIMAVIAIMLMPLPAFLIDLLLAVNITLSILILFVSLYTVEPLEFSTFPSILLITTLFRLSLNIASTRLILLNGNRGDVAAGQIIKSFGDSVVGGNYVVGIIVFLILVLINFVVITKGAGRIAEVGARFALDAMPGKQMAIDADLNAGVIDDATAQSRRKKIQRESDFYGAMDGASKFVRGDAIAGLIITGINIVGGLVIGVTVYGMDFGRAAAAYTTLTVGDGLVSQIPALIISTAAGISVSKAGRENKLGKDFHVQVFGNIRAMSLASATMFMVMLVDGMPKFPFIILGSTFAYLAWKVYQNRNKEAEMAELTQRYEEQQEKTEDVSSLLSLDTLSLELGYGLIPLVDPDQDGELLERVKAIRRQIALDFGFVVPSVHIKDNLQLDSGSYSILVKGIEVGKGNMKLHHYLAMENGEADEKIAGEPTTEPAFGLPAVWVAGEDKETAELNGYTVVDVPTVIATHITEIIKNYSFEFLGRQDVQKILDRVAEKEPKLVEDLTPGTLGLGVIQRTLQNLLRENVSIRDANTILETLCDHGAHTKDPELLTEFVRESIAGNLTKPYLNEEGELPIMTLETRLEMSLEESVETGQMGSFLVLKPEHMEELQRLIERSVEKFSAFNYHPVIVTSAKIRRHLKRATERIVPSLTVLANNELKGGVKILNLGMIEESFASDPSPTVN